MAFISAMLASMNGTDTDQVITSHQKLRAAQPNCEVQ